MAVKGKDAFKAKQEASKDENVPPNEHAVLKTQINIIHFSKVFKTDNFVDRIIDNLKGIIKVKKGAEAKMKAIRSASLPPPVQKQEKILSDESSSDSESL